MLIGGSGLLNKSISSKVVCSWALAPPNSEPGCAKALLRTKEN